MTTPVLQGRGGRLAVTTAVAGTVLIALGAFWLSFTALADLAKRSGISEGQAWAWPLIVDGIIVVATVSVVALAGHSAAWYPWVLLAAGALVSVTANAIHAVIAADADVPQLLAASVAAVPSLVLLAITHLTVILTRPIPSTESTATATDDPLDDARDESAGVESNHDDALNVLWGTVPELPTTATATSTDAADVPEVSTDSGERDRRAVATDLRGQGWSNKRIANQAFFDKLYLSEEGTVIGEPGEPFDAFFDPGVQTAAARHEGRAAASRSQTGNVAGLNNDLLVGPAGLEPATRGLKVRCSTN